MRPSQAMSAFIMLSILMGSSIGCIGLVPAREFMEDMRGPAKVNQIIDKINIDHVFVTQFGSPVPLPVPSSVSYTESFDFNVDSDVTEISAYITFAVAADFLSLPSQLTTEVRYVEATLRDANGDTVWSERLTETKRPAVATFGIPFAEGIWTLDVDAKGYGEEVGNLYKDSFQVLIKIERNCWVYPPEVGCSEY
jgi:hypothetical protein